jgi:hypothetical protein
MQVWLEKIKGSCYASKKINNNNKGVDDLYKERCGYNHVILALKL